MGLGNSTHLGAWHLHALASLLVLVGPLSGQQAGDVVINELMYHVKATEFKEEPRAEFVELHNTSDRDIDLNGWSFDAGLRYTFPEVILPAGNYLVLAADPDFLKQQHPDLATVLGPYQGRLSNGGERLKLIDADEREMDEVTYADSGFWAEKRLGKLRGYDDWAWHAPHDGEGHSLELIQPRFDNAPGQAWATSKTAWSCSARS